jgi:hypothetical protein
MDFENLPEAVRALPRDPRGYPVPWFVATLPDGTRDLRVADGKKRITGWKRGLCWVCGGKLGKEMCFIGGPYSVINRVFADWAMHKDCGVAAVRICPFINGTMKRRRQNDMPDGAEALEGARPEAPEYAGLYVTVGEVRLGPQGHFLAPPPRYVWWYRAGERVPESAVAGLLEATRAAIREELRRREAGYLGPVVS